MKIFLDDYRQAKDAASYMHTRIGALNIIYLEEWWIAKDYEDFKKIIESAYVAEVPITHVSFDHDLADEHYTPEEYWDDYEKNKEYQKTKIYKEKTGYDCAKWMKEFYEEKGMELPICFCHSMNPVGIERIYKLLNLK